MTSSSNLSKFCRTKLWVQSTSNEKSSKIIIGNNVEMAETTNAFVLSPVSDLVFHLNNQSLEGTPRRRLSLDTVSSSGTPSTTPEKPFEKKSKAFTDFALDTLPENDDDDVNFEEIKIEGILTEISPGRQARSRLVERRSVTFDDDDESLSPNSLEQNKENLRRPPLIQVTRQTSTTCYDLEELRSPVLISPAPSSVFLDEDSQDSGYAGSQGSRKASYVEDTFLAPSALPPHRIRQKSIVLKRSRDEDDDGFMEELERENDGQSTISGQFETLLQGPLLGTPSPSVTRSEYSCLDQTPVKRKSGLDTVLLVNFTGGMGMKRPSSVNDEQTSTDCTEPDMKRRKSVAEAAFTTLKVPNSILMHRCHSESEVVHALQRVEENFSLIGDFSNNHILPLISSPKIADLKCISGQTVCDVFDGRYNDLIKNFVVVDCRYPYEYEGGHIRGALNIYEKDNLEKFLMNDEILTKQKNEFSIGKRNVLLFYCEFSKERGPKMSRFLRAQDRKRNEYRYPKLDYPEIYLLEGGYKSFFEKFQFLCEPQRYKPMTHRDHIDDLRKFRIKSKSWSSFGAETLSVAGPPPAAKRRPGLNRGLFT